MKALVIILTILAVCFSLVGFLLTLGFGFFLYKIKKISKKDFKLLAKIKAVSWSGALVIGWLCGFISILLTQ